MRLGITTLMMLMLGTTAFVAAQTKTVTNADLEKYRTERLKADREYRENYARLGMPSPEEIERRREQSRTEMRQLSDKLRTERLEDERLELQRYALQQQAILANRQVVDNSPYYDGFYGGSAFYSSGRRGRVGRQYAQPGYFAGGQFWPTGTRTPSRPIMVTPRLVRPTVRPR